MLKKASAAALPLVLAGGLLGLTASPASAATFHSCSEAKAAGYENMLEGTYGYSAGLDRDNDKVACENPEVNGPQDLAPVQPAPAQPTAAPHPTVPTQTVPTQTVTTPSQPAVVTTPVAPVAAPVAPVAAVPAAQVPAAPQQVAQIPVGAPETGAAVSSQKQEGAAPLAALSLLGAAALGLGAYRFSRRSA